MRFLGLGTALFAVLFVVGLLVVLLVVRLRGGSVRRTLRRSLTWFLLLLPVHLLVVVPAALGYLGSRMIGTRPDERGYAGPRLGADGATIAPMRLRSTDGLEIRAFHVPAPVEPPVAGSWVLAHGLFRNAREVEPVAGMLHDLGAEVVLVELRNHGGSDRAPASFGLREADDVLAAVRWLEGGDRQRARIGLFGVSLGTVAVAMAAPRVAGLRAVVLDAPIDDLPATASRMLARGPRARWAVPWPIRPLAIEAIQLWSDFDFDLIQPYDAVRSLPKDVALMLIGAGDDFRVPPAQVRAFAESLVGRDPVPITWIREGSRHGHVWLDDPEGYRARLAELIARTL